MFKTVPVYEPTEPQNKHSRNTTPPHSMNQWANESSKCTYR